MTRPRCLNCGAPLKASRRTVLAAHLVPKGAIDIREEPHPSAKNGRKYTFQPPGEFGPYGDGFFCTKNCGYQLALRMARTIPAATKMIAEEP